MALKPAWRGSHRRWPERAAALTVEDTRLVPGLIEIAEPLSSSPRGMWRALEQVAGGELGSFAHVDDDGVFTVDEWRWLGGLSSRPPRSEVTTSITPLTAASAAQYQFCWMNQRNKPGLNGKRDGYYESSPQNTSRHWLAMSWSA